MSETKSVLSGIVHFNLFDDIAFYIDAIIIGLAIIFAILVICIVIKKFLCDKKINSKTFSIYNLLKFYHILYIIKLFFTIEKVQKFSLLYFPYFISSFSSYSLRCI